MDEKQFDEPKNSLGQSPIDQCCDAVFEGFSERGIELDADTQALIPEALKTAISMWAMLFSETSS